MMIKHSLLFSPRGIFLFSVLHLTAFGLSLSGQIAPPSAPPQKKWMVSFGIRTFSGPEVEFTNLGMVPNNLELAPFSNEILDRIYHDGSVLTDPEAPQAGTTRNWSYRSEAQIPGNDTIEFHYYSATETGFNTTAETDLPYGFEIDLDYALGGNFDRGIAWGLSAGVGLSTFDASASSAYTGDLNVTTDVYGLNGVTPPEPPYQSTAAGENATAIEGAPRSRSTQVIPGGASLTGEWDLKGAFYTVRMGPFLYMPLGESWGARISAGVSATYLGTEFTAAEVLLPPTGNPTSNLTTERDGDWSPGAYADVAAHYRITPQTAFFAAARYHAVADEFVQASQERRATVDMTSLQLTFGFSFRF